ncbi:hypothetical protein R5R35_010052 [Gryllus longicercus]|uniref:Neurotransmitter-gated ion-channel ligand-binding domain-containing protein n=1 Tax=Gryllus longicercus TaxID=2509291 RepID=A0AAN9Z258_9ORTH
MLRPGPRALLLSFFLQILATGTSQVTCPTRPLNYEKELKKCLLQDYEKTVRPAGESETITTVLNMHVRTIDLLEHDSQMKIHAWTIWEWTDNNLKWNPGDFGNVRSIKMLSDDIWQPDISLMTTDDANMHFGIPSTYCEVSNLGKVLCAPPTTLLAHCVPDIRRWPFDEQTCSIVMGSWSQLASKLNLTISGTGVTLNQLPNGLWDMKWSSARVVLTQHGKSDYYPTIEYTFVLRRHSAADMSTAVAPALVLATTTLLTLLLEPGCSERLIMGITNVLAHVLYLQYTSWRLPPNGDTVPAIVVFFRDSLVLVGAALVLGVATRRLVQARSPPPDWLRSAAASLLAHAPGQLLLLGRLSARGSAATAGTAGEDGATLVSSGDSVGGVDGGGGGSGVGGGSGRGEAWSALDDTWQLAAIFLDRVALAVFFLALLSLFARYIA